MVFVYSDESGRESREDEVYVRSFIFVDGDKKDEMEKILEEFKNKKNTTKELKFKNLQLPLDQDIKDCLLNIDFKFLAFFTRKSSFDVKKNNEYNIFKGLRGFLDLYGWLEKRFEMIIFLEKFESKYFMAIRKILEDHYNGRNSKITCDNFGNDKYILPFFQDRISPYDGEFIAEDSKSSLGIQLSDIISGIFKKLIEQESNKGSDFEIFCKELVEKKGFNKTLTPKDGYDIGKYPCCSAVMLSDHTQDKDRLSNGFNKFYEYYKKKQNIGNL